MKTLPLLTVTTLCLAACQSGGQNTLSAADINAQIAASNETWQLVDGNVNGKALNLQAGNGPITLVFTPNGISGKSPVNQYHANADIRGSAFSLSSEMMTTRVGSNPAAMYLERDYLTALRQSDNYRREGNQLILSGNGSELRYQLQPGSALPVSTP